MRKSRCSCAPRSRSRGFSGADEIEFDSDELEAAEHWHGGQYSLLYAISSTGSLRRGTMRPSEDGRPLTDDEWLISLAESLSAEATRTALLARNESRRTRGKERAEFLRDYDALMSIAEKADQFVEKQSRGFGSADDLDEPRRCPECEKVKPADVFSWTHDRYGIPWKKVCDTCYDRVEAAIQEYEFDPSYAGEALEPDDY